MQKWFVLIIVYLLSGSIEVAGQTDTSLFIDYSFFIEDGASIIAAQHEHQKIQRIQHPSGNLLTQYEIPDVQTDSCF